MSNSTSITSTSGVTLISASGPLRPALLNAMCRSLQPGRSPKADTTARAAPNGSAGIRNIQLPLPSCGMHAMRN
ncbi:hypothetical protein G6F31_018068 [Rhizopus arrhizus]|nr:hypothetical protein G6F31_018068 [Rhizopus arrhizus]